MNININKEKEQFNDFIKYLKNEDLNNVQPLFYRKVLSEIEIDRLLNKIDTLHTLQVISLTSEKLKNILKVTDFTEALFKHNVNKVYELSTSTRFYTSYEMDLCAFNPFTKFNEDWYWFTNDVDWMIRFDHEGYAYIYGNWFIDELGLNSL